MIEKYKHVIWDWNGTLLDDTLYCVNLVNNLLIEQGLPVLSVDKYKAIFNFPVQAYYEEAGLTFEKESFESVSHRWMASYEKDKLTCPLAAGAVEVLNSIKAKGVEQSILSAYRQDTLLEIISYHGLTGYFAHIAGLDNIYAAGKVGIGKELIAKLGLEEGESLLIGDTTHDYEVARAIGADCLLLASGHQDTARLAKTGAIVLDGLQELLKVL
ncbi:MAG: HAD family hydrolase [Ignavibacteria bacterium]|nr:HAD family hydrolase [Ignavibacteria bacterium]